MMNPPAPRLRRRRLLAQLASAPALLAAPAVHAQTAWPTGPVRIIVPYPTGGSNDTVARILQPRLQEILGQPVKVENRGGASGSIGAGEAAKAAPDGSAWILVNDTLAANDTLMSLPYKSTDSFSYATLIGTCPFALVTQKNSPYQTFADVVAAAKKTPGGLNYATTGTGSLAHIATVLLEKQGGFSLTHVPYRGGGPALQDVLAGNVPLFMSNIVILLPHLRSGALRALGVTSAAASRFVQGVAPFAQQGFPGFEAETYWALLGPAGVPRPVVEKMQTTVASVLREPQIRARMEEQGADIIASPPDACAAFIRKEAAKWAPVIRDNNIHADG